MSLWLGPCLFCLGPARLWILRPLLASMIARSRAFLRLPLAIFDPHTHPRHRMEPRTADTRSTRSAMLPCLSCYGSSHNWQQGLTCLFRTSLWVCRACKVAADASHASSRSGAVPSGRKGFELSDQSPSWDHASSSSDGVAPPSFIHTPKFWKAVEERGNRQLSVLGTKEG